MPLSLRTRYEQRMSPVSYAAGVMKSEQRTRKLANNWSWNLLPTLLPANSR